MHSTFGFKLISQEYDLIIFIAVIIILLSMQASSLAHELFHVAKSTVLHENLIIGVPRHSPTLAPHDQSHQESHMSLGHLNEFTKH